VVSASIGKQPCSAIRRDGRPCQADARPGRAWCWAHDPDLDGRRAEARRRGGHHKATTVRLSARLPADLRDVLDLVTSALGQVHAGTMPASRGQAVASLARAAAAIYGEHEIERRLDEIERRLDAVHTTRR
jgi:hypothetical protein